MMMMMMMMTMLMMMMLDQLQGIEHLPVRSQSTCGLGSRARLERRSV